MLSAGLSPGSPGANPKRHRSTDRKRRQLQDKLAQQSKGAPLTPAASVDLLLLEVPHRNTLEPAAGLKQQYSKPKHARASREAPRTTFYRRLGRRNM